MIRILSSSCKNCVINVGIKWTLQMSIPQYQVLSPIYMVSFNTVFSIPQNQCYSGKPRTFIVAAPLFFLEKRKFANETSIVYRTQLAWLSLVQPICHTWLKEKRTLEKMLHLLSFLSFILSRKTMNVTKHAEWRLFQ